MESNVSMPVIACHIRSCDSSVGVVTRLQAGRQKNRGSIAGRDKRFIFVKIVHTSSWAWLPWVLVLGRDIDHSSPSGADLKDQWRYALVSYTGTSGAMA